MPFGPNRLRNSTAPLPYCDTCGKLASHNASAYVELKPKWWRGLWFPKFQEQEEALMGCPVHRVEPEIRFLDGHVERFVKLPETRLKRHWWEVFLAIVLAIIAAWIFR
jgi:hypothetical protein